MSLLQGPLLTKFTVPANYYNFLHRIDNYVEFKALAAMIMKGSVCWDITRCSPLKVNRRFGGVYHLHLKGLRISQARVKAGRKERLLTFNRLQSVNIPEDRTLQYRKLFIT
jgi:hypothetical protein